MTDQATIAEGDLPIYRPLMLEPGESLLLARDAVQFMARLVEFPEATGVPTDALVVTPVISIPLPIYPPTFDGGARRWPSVKPEAMWHPLLWLPEVLASRFPVSIDDGRGSPREGVEPDDIWAVRVAIELTQSRLYDQESGMWVDVLALAGLDIQQVEVQQRVQAWLNGAPDRVLDAIDLSGYLMPDAEWVLKEAAANAGGLRHAAFAAVAGDLLDKLDHAATVSGGHIECGDLLAVAQIGDALELARGSHDPQFAMRMWLQAVSTCEAALGIDGVAADETVLQVADTVRSELAAVRGANESWLTALTAAA